MRRSRSPLIWMRRMGLAKNDRLIGEIARELVRAEARSRRSGKPARCFKRVY